MAKCVFCDKGVTFGRNIRHQATGGWFRRAPRTSRTFKANVQRTTITESGHKFQVNVCTKCLRTMYRSR
ncbi:MAG: hypothetical protein RL076_1107 [Chloroflexota bacterium]|jgi:large subunit ribosomal protein L28